MTVSAPSDHYEDCSEQHLLVAYKQHIKGQLEQCNSAVSLQSNSP
ncbi:MAG TPA: hypothetical protein VIC26_14080 [Marinagarivorans sp.]